MSDELKDEPFSVEVTDRETVYEGAVWNIVSETFDYNGGPITRQFMDHTGAVAILALDEDDRVLLIRQYRHPVRSRDWEIPAGLLDEEGEQPLAAAQRELAEEADLAADRWNVLAEYQNSPGGSNETVRVYLARGLRQVEAFARTAEEADIEVRWVALDEVVDAVLARRVENPSTMMGVLSLVAWRSSGRSLDDLDAGDSPWPRHPKLGSGSW